MLTISQLKRRVLRRSLFRPCSLEKAIQRLGFVQADPIRSPARAQDLILRHRVKGYQAGDLERGFSKLKLEESFLYAYGFLPSPLWEIIHPKTDEPFTQEQESVLQWIAERGPVHPRELEELVGNESARNCWGGSSRTGKLILESLHHRGALRVARREKGIRIYEVAKTVKPTLSKEERFQEIMCTALKSMGATTQKFLLSEVAHFRYLASTRKERLRGLEALIESGRVRIDVVDSVEYLSLAEGAEVGQALDLVRILAPFDPIVRDRSRFEHLWGWSYRFEAYTPKAKRKMGYYAMPVLWKEDIIGWANASVENRRLQVDFGYVKQQPREKAFKASAEAEVARLAQFLGLEEEYVVTSS